MVLIRSLAFDIFFYGLMGIMGILCAPLALWSRDGAVWSIHRYTDIVLWVLPRLTGLRWEVRGEVPGETCLVVSKHQSFLDILILANVLPQPRFIMKQSLRWAPVLGFYAMRIGCAPVNRGAKSEAVKKMVSDFSRDVSGQTIIYPQGTRVAPGAVRPYKIGAAALYKEHGLPCALAATNAGLFWARKGKLRRPGLAVVEFLEPPIPPGLPRERFMAEIEERIETASNALMDEARALQANR